jgi:Nodulation protein S (NodS)
MTASSIWTRAAYSRAVVGAEAGDSLPTPGTIRTPDFDTLYEHDNDPWRVATSFYEQRKLGIVLACLASARYGLAWDPACGIGELAARLADRCDRVLATDASAIAVQIARNRCAAKSNVFLSQLALPAEDILLASPAEPDVIVLAEFLYYLAPEDRDATLDVITKVAAGSAEVIALHWRHRPDDAWLSGAEMQAEIVDGLANRSWRHTQHHLDEDFILDGFRR